MVKLPKGMTIQVSFWLTSDKAARMSTMSSDELFNQLDDAGLKRWRKDRLKARIKALNEHFGVTDFRLMTADEIAAATIGTQH